MKKQENCQGHAPKETEDEYSTSCANDWQNQTAKKQTFFITLCILLYIYLYVYSVKWTRPKVLVFFFGPGNFEIQDIGHFK